MQHHYVPRFYLERFADPQGRVWVFDKSTEKVFASNPEKLARESGFYEVQSIEVDQSAMESILSELEGASSQVIARWACAIGNSPAGAMIVADEDREIMSTYIATQAFRTSEQRIILEHGLKKSPDDIDLQSLHVALLCDDFM